MERASLRPVPTPPPSDVDPAEAFAYVSTQLPGLDESARRALSLVELSGLSRGAAAERLDLGSGAISELLARARKALRRASFPLNASGWCERAERLISDRLDDALEAPGPARLDAHLHHCDRCVEHERRLDQARDSLVRGFVAARESVAAAPETTVEEPAVEEPAVEEPAAAEPAAAAEPPPTVEPLRKPAPAAPKRRAVATQAKRPAAVAPAPAEEPRSAGKLAIAAAWSFMFALVIVLTIASVVLIVLGASGVNVV